MTDLGDLNRLVLALKGTGDYLQDIADVIDAAVRELNPKGIDCSPIAALTSQACELLGWQDILRELADGLANYITTGRLPEDAVTWPKPRDTENTRPSPSRR